MLKHGKTYLVTKRTEEANIYRGGELVGTFPEVGFQVQIFGQCTALAGTELAAHALAEVYKDVSPYRRQWVLSGAEYDEHVSVLQDHLERLLAAWPYTPEEAASVEAHYQKYKDIDKAGKESVRRKLLNLNPYDTFANWNPNPIARPKDFPAVPEDDQTATFGMR